MGTEFFIAVDVFPMDYQATKFQWSALQIGQDSSIYTPFPSSLMPLFQNEFVRNLSYQNLFCTQFLFHANQSNFHTNGFALRLALKQSHKGTRESPIGLSVIDRFSLRAEPLSYFFVTNENNPTCT